MIDVKPLLGYISVTGATLDDNKPAANNTRWIFDVDGTIDEGGGVKLQLLDVRSRRPLPLNLFACVMTARNSHFYDARPHFNIEHDVLILRHAAPVACSYRVMLDVMHSATR
jgi:hypothetical protein